MPPRSTQSALPLPRGWRKITRAGVLHAISSYSETRPSNCPRDVMRYLVEENQVLKEQMGKR